MQSVRIENGLSNMLSTRMPLPLHGLTERAPYFISDIANDQGLTRGGLSLQPELASHRYMGGKLVLQNIAHIANSRSTMNYFKNRHGRVLSVKTCSLAY